MSRSAGTGSPVWFKCWRERSTLEYHDRDYRVELTGRVRLSRRGRYHTRGLRSSGVDREYRCLYCGHVGWSNHIDLARLAGDTETY